LVRTRERSAVRNEERVEGEVMVVVENEVARSPVLATQLRRWDLTQDLFCSRAHAGCVTNLRSKKYSKLIYIRSTIVVKTWSYADCTATFALCPIPPPVWKANRRSHVFANEEERPAAER
jgi:hypothetical protein